MSAVDFARAIAPVEPERFDRDYLERAPLHVGRNDARYFESLCSLEELDRFHAVAQPTYAKAFAIDARRKGDPDSAKGRSAVAMRQEGEAVVITVTDNGIGLPQDRERITEPYMTTREKGTGLGLAIVKKIIEEHGGDMGFALAEGGGTHVTMRFARDPLSAPRGAEAAA